MKQFSLLLLFFSITVFGQVELDLQKFMVFPSPGTFTQTEPVAAFHPLNNSILFVSAVTFNVSSTFKSEGIYISTDGGYTWTGNDTCKGESYYNHGGDPGVAITENGRLVLTHIALSPFTGMYSNYSDDFGLTWSVNNNITSNQSEDKGTLAIDHLNQSSFKGRLYLTWVDYIVNPFTVRSSFSSDDGENWSQPLLVNPNPPTRSSGTSVAIGCDGTVYLCWTGVTAAFPFHEDYIGFALSADGGLGWNVNQNIIDINGIAGLLPQKSNIKVNGIPQIGIDDSGGPRNNWLYIITTEKDNPPAGSDPDIILHRSSNNGLTWSQGIRVNQDALNNGKIQYFPYLDVDEFGNLNILFYNDRNTTSDSASVFLTRSTDGGDTWIEFAVKNTTFKPKPISGGPSNYQGDHIALISRGNKLNAFWMADYTGIYQIWSVVIDDNLLVVNEHAGEPVNSFSLSQNFPNPFNPSTSIKYSIAEETHVTLKVYDSIGREVKTLVNKMHSPGNYEINFEPADISSGIYLYTLRAGKFQQTKKMLYLK